MTAIAARRALPVRESARTSVRRTLHQLDDSRLAERHLAGDPQAFGALVDRYQTPLLNFINRTIADRERAEDLVQEAFIRVFRHLHRFDRTKKFSTWVYTIASNLAKNELRVGQVPEALRDVFVLRELQGKTYQEIGAITGCNVGTVKSRLSRARSTFAQLIKPLLE
jgi:RNA polymerase sigma-70 factor (ECF subfamily)